MKLENAKRTNDLDSDMAAVKKFVQETDHKTWTTALSLYDKVLNEKANTKSKAGASAELKKLDKWYQNELPSIIQERDEKYITVEEMVELMKWKLSRGKFRPRLVDFAGSNGADEVKSKSKEAFKKLEKGNVKGAIEALSKLKGIGPATASAILAAGSPDLAAFMSDEPTRAILGEGTLKYNVQEYMAYMEGVNQCVQELNQKAPTISWTPHKVELALWTYYLADKLKPELLESAKRKSTTGDAESGDSSEEEGKKKKSKK